MNWVARAIFHGLIGAGLAAGCLFGLYARGPESIVGASFFLCFGLIVMAMILAGWQERRLNKEVLPFNKAFRLMFITSVIGFVGLYTAQLYLISNDPDLMAYLHQLDMQQGGVAVGQESNQPGIEFNFRNIIKYFTVALGFSLVFSILSALVLRRKN